MEIGATRKFFPVVANQLYLNHAACSPFSTKVKDIITSFIESRNQDKVDDFREDMKEADTLRGNIARLINTTKDRIALTSNTTHGLNIIASGLSWKPNDEILLSTMEFPANVYPYLNLENNGVNIRWIPSNKGRITVEDIIPRINKRTRLLSLSFVQYLNGYKADLQMIGEFCKENDIWFILDGIQGLGAFPIDLEKTHIDAIASGGHKWLMSPKGTGFLYLSENLQRHLSQKHLGWLSAKNPFEFHNFEQDLNASAQRYELATPNQIGIYGMKVALDLIIELGVANISKHILTITGHLRERLAALGCQVLTTFGDRERGGIVLFSCGEPDENSRIFKELLARDITISLRDGQLRISPHFYNNKDDMDKFITSLKGVM